MTHLNTTPLKARMGTPARRASGAPLRYRPRRSGRAVVVGVVLVVVLVLTTALAVSLGSFSITPDRLLATVFGNGSATEAKVVFQWRMPRAVTAIVFGAGLALSGAIFQALTRNPLGSPDIIGFSTGAFTGVLIVMVAGATTYASIAGGALIGGVVTAIVIYVFAFSNGVQGFRLIIVGIAMSAMLGSVNTWITVKADIDLAMSAAVWGAGTLSDLRWPTVWPALVGIALLTVALLGASRWLSPMELGDDAAGALGVRVELSKLVLMLIGVGFTAAVTAISGPIGFVALVSPQLARRLTGTGTPGLVTTALVGAALLSVSDVVAEHAIDNLPMPVGAVTVSIGGLYLVWLLAVENRRR